MATQIPATGFLRLHQILEFFPISKSAWWKGCATGRYPKPLKIGPRTTVWRAEDIRAFIENAGSEQFTTQGNPVKQG